MKSNLQFGLFLPAFTHGTTFNYLVDLTLLCEKLNLDSVWICDHLLGVDSVVSDRTHGFPEVYESTVTLAALAMATKKIRLGTAVSALPYRNPALYAKQIAILDIISNGRLEFGFGAGWRQREFEAYGIGFEPFNVRLERTEEAIKLIDMLLTNPSVSYSGKYYNVDRCEINPRCIQRPRPRFWLGGAGPRLMKTLLPYSDGWLPPAVSIDLILNRKPIIQQAQKQRGTKITIGIEFYTTIDDKREIAIKKADPAIKEWFGYSVEEIEKLFDAPFKIELESSPFRTIGKPALAVGNHEDCIELIDTYRKVGVELFVLHFMPPMDSHSQLRQYADKVIPYFHDQ